MCVNTSDYTKCSNYNINAFELKNTNNVHVAMTFNLKNNKAVSYFGADKLNYELVHGMRINIDKINILFKNKSKNIEGFNNFDNGCILLIIVFILIILFCYLMFRDSNFNF
jgi:hypothetical protein